jgi:hypothetical protein
MTTETAPALKPVYLDLGPTAAYPRRRAGWFAGPRPGAPRLGTLRVVQDKKGRTADAADVAEYAVRETLDAVPAGVRTFALLGDGDGAEEYRATVGSDERGLVWDRCTCKAGRHAKRCKHLDALAAFISEGVI